MVVTLGQQYNIGEKPTVILYTYINRNAGTPEKQRKQKHCSTYYAKLRTTHHGMLLQILGAWCKSPNQRILSYKDALQRTQCESIEATVRTRRLLWAGALLRTGDHRLPKRVMSGELENAGKHEGERVDGLRGR